MDLFSFVSDWKVKLIDEPLDRKMAECAKLGEDVARAAAHVVSGANKASVGATYDRSTKRIMLHADMPYSAIEEQRPGHAYLAVGANAMARMWGSNYQFELHYPNAAAPGVGTSKVELMGRETRYRKASLTRGNARYARTFYRRHHRLSPAPLFISPVTSPIL
jgi:hypothetical protein